MVRSRASKGAVTVESFRGKLRLHLPRSIYGGKNKYLSLGLNDTPENREKAEFKAKEIEANIFHERFDPTLAKYKPQTYLISVPEKPSKPKPTLKKLWEEYLEYASVNWMECI